MIHIVNFGILAVLATISYIVAVIIADNTY